MQKFRLIIRDSCPVLLFLIALILSIIVFDNMSAYAFTDDFSTNTTGEYTVTDTWTAGGVGQFNYDSSNQRVEVLTGNDVSLQFSHALSALDTGVFSIDFLPVVTYPNGGSFTIQLKQDANNYYEVKNTDGYGPRAIKKVVGGVEVDSASFVGEYSQNTNFTIRVTFSPGSTTVEAFGEVLNMSTNGSTITVSSFEVLTSQQDAYYDNIEYSTM